MMFPYHLQKHRLLFDFTIFMMSVIDLCLRAIKRSNCYHESHGKDPCHMSSNGYMVTFGITEVILSQIPDFDQVWWLSIVAAIMSFTYSAVGLGLGVAKVAGTSKKIYISHVHNMYMKH